MSGKQETNWEFQICQYIDGLLNEAETAELEKKLAADPALRETLARYQALEDQLTSIADDVVDIDFDLQRRDIMDKIDVRRAEASGKFRWMYKPVAAVCAIAAVLVVAFGVYMIARTVLPGPQAEQVQTASSGNVVKSVYRRPNPLRTGNALATVLPAAPEHTAKGIVQVLARRMADKDLQAKASPSKPPAGTVLVSIGSPRKADESLRNETAADDTEFWFSG